MVQPERDGLALERPATHDISPPKPGLSSMEHHSHHWWSMTWCLLGFIISLTRSCFSQGYFDLCAAMPQGHDIQPVTVHKQGTNLSFCYTLNVTLEYDVLGLTWPRNPFPTFHTRSKHSMLLNIVVAFSSSFSVRSSVDSVPYLQVLEPGTCGVRMHYAIRSPTILQPSTHTSKCSSLWWW